MRDYKIIYTFYNVMVFLTILHTFFFKQSAYSTASHFILQLHFKTANICDDFIRTKIKKSTKNKVSPFNITQTVGSDNEITI